MNMSYLLLHYLFQTSHEYYNVDKTFETRLFLINYIILHNSFVEYYT